MNTLTAPGMRLEPLTAGHADVLFPLLSDPRLYEHLDYGPPATVEHLRDLYRKLETRRSPNGREGWLNWVVFLEPNEPTGYVQATVLEEGHAWVAYVLGSAYWRRGIARRATEAMLHELRTRYACTRFLACCERDNTASIALLRSLGFIAAGAHEPESAQLATKEVLYVLHASPKATR